MISFSVNRNLPVPLIRQVYEHIRNQIISGTLQPDDKIPSSRELAQMLTVSRNVILEAYQLLIMEGYVISKPHSGTYVAKLIGTYNYDKQNNLRESRVKQSYIGDNSGQSIIDLRTGIPALENFPIKKWAKFRNDIFLDSPHSLMSYSPGTGIFELKEAISKYLLKIRGLQCNPQQIIITNCSIQSFSLLTQFLTSGNKQYIIEDPCHIEIKRTIAQVNNNFISVGVDEEGILTDKLPKNIQPAYIMTTPSHQYPTGAIMSARRRLQLIDYAIKYNTYIIEDDYDSEFGYNSPPLTPLAALAPQQVIYAGTFSKILFPGIRIAYVILPDHLIKTFSQYKRYSDYFNNVYDQLALAQFIEDGLLDKHIFRMHKIYRKKRDILIQSLNEEFNDKIQILGASTGLHLMVRFQDVYLNDEILKKCQESGILLHPAYLYAHDKKYPHNLLPIGYSHLDLANIPHIIKNLHKLLSAFSG